MELSGAVGAERKSNQLMAKKNILQEIWRRKKRKTNDEGLIFNINRLLSG